MEPNLQLWVGNAAVICTVASCFAGLPICLDVVRKKSTSGVSALPFLCGLVNSSLWLLYGVLVRDSAVMVVNTIAGSLQCCYLGCFSYATIKEKNTSGSSFWHRLVFCCCLLLSVLVYATRADPEASIQTVGFLACSGSIAMVGSPLAGLGEVFRSGSTRHLPFLMIASSFATTLLWCTYGVLVGDLFIKLPNLIGALLSGFQLSLFAVFDSTPAKKAE